MVSLKQNLSSLMTKALAQFDKISMPQKDPESMKMYSGSPGILFAFYKYSLFMN